MSFESMSVGGGSKKPLRQAEIAKEFNNEGVEVEPRGQIEADARQGITTQEIDVCVKGLDHVLDLMKPRGIDRSRFIHFLSLKYPELPEYPLFGDHWYDNSDSLQYAGLREEVFLEIQEYGNFLSSNRDTISRHTAQEIDSALKESEVARYYDDRLVGEYTKDGEIESSYQDNQKKIIRDASSAAYAEKKIIEADLSEMEMKRSSEKLLIEVTARLKKDLADIKSSPKGITAAKKTLPVNKYDNPRWPREWPEIVPWPTDQMIEESNDRQEGIKSYRAGYYAQKGDKWYHYYEPIFNDQLSYLNDSLYLGGKAIVSTSYDNDLIPYPSHEEKYHPMFIPKEKGRGRILIPTDAAKFLSILENEFPNNEALETLIRHCDIDMAYPRQQKRLSEGNF